MFGSNLEVCHPRCVKSNITVYNMYYIYIQSETQQLIDGITMYYTLHCNKQRHVSAL